MKSTLYAKLAFEGMRKNKKLYIPYILTGIGMVMMFFIVSFLSCSEGITRLKGGKNITETLGVGKFVIGVFALIFLFYTNSFLMRRRKKEFGLYNIMGLSKTNISVILVLENLFLYCISTAGGLFGGTILSKAAELVLTKIMRGIPTVAFSFAAKPFGITLLVFGIIFVLMLFRSLGQVQVTSPVELLHSENYGEKTPKVNWVFGIAGVSVLAFAYYSAISAKSPVEALTTFLVAVILVIIATYLLFISGSVMLCHLLKKKKNYYYKTNHFVSVSQMMFRMKRGGAGLASICILSTMVLVMMVSTASLYFGAENSMHTRYPYDLEAAVTFQNAEDMAEYRGDVDRITENYMKSQKAPVTEALHVGYTYITAMVEDNRLEIDPRKVEYNFFIADICTFVFYSQEDYNRITGDNLHLEKNQTYIYSVRGFVKNQKVLNFSDYLKLNVAGEAKNFFMPGSIAANITNCCICVISDFDVLRPLDVLADFSGDKMMPAEYYYGVSTAAQPETQIKQEGELADLLLHWKKENKSDATVSVTALASQRDDFYGTFGGLFFLGIILSLIFMFATVMIIYYKQISEGYEDAPRFAIMQKVGMTKAEIKKSINSQMLTVFFAPVLMAAAHLAAAFPAIRNILLMFNLTDMGVILGTTGIAVAAFVLFYTLVYKITSNEYYRIVSNEKK